MIIINLWFYFCAMSHLLQLVASSLFHEFPKKRYDFPKKRHDFPSFFMPSSMIFPRGMIAGEIRSVPGHQVHDTHQFQGVELSREQFRNQQVVDGLTGFFLVQCEAPQL